MDNNTQAIKIKKSTAQQLSKLVDHMEANPEFARGVPAFGSSRQSMEENWRKLALKLNSIGPPTRSAVEWKKTWVDLKSRTKKKLADNHSSIMETGGGDYRVNSLTPLEEVIDRTLFLSKSAAPEGRSFGSKERNLSSIDKCFVSLVSSPPGTSRSFRQESINTSVISLVDTPPRTSKTVAVVTPTRQSGAPQHQTSPQCLKRKKNEVPRSSAKTRKTDEDEQLSLIRRQVQLSEKTVAAAEKQAIAMTTIADAVLRIVVASEKQAEAAKEQVEATKRCADAMEKCVEKLGSYNENTFNSDLDLK